MALHIAPTRILLSVGVLVISLCLVLSLAPNNVSAATGPTQVRGHVYDPYGDPAVGANVFVEFLVGGEPRERTWEGTTDSYGYYQSTNWLPDKWEVGDTIRVTVTYNSEQRIQTKIAVDGLVQVVDVHYPTAIPQLGGLIGTFAAIGIVGAVAVVFIRKKNREAN